MKKLLGLLGLVVLAAALTACSVPETEASDGGPSNGIGSAEADADMGRVRCTTAYGLISGTIEITNHSSGRSDYYGEVVFTSPDGARQLGDGLFSVSGLAPGQSATADITSMDDAPAGEFNCEVTTFQRTASV